ncbi:leukocidin family pore-forming toxin [Vibrio cidicii]|nr:leukocidin family pore-forming toxin [Vibrio cidicii]
MRNLALLSLLALSTTYVNVTQAGQVATDNGGYIPIFERSFYLTRTNLSCNMPTSDGGTIIDYCDGGAVIDLKINVAQGRSINLSGVGIQTEDKKFVRFFSDESNSGTGIHLADSMKQGDSWYSTGFHKDTYIGPFAQSYKVKIEPIQNNNYGHSNSRLSKHLPKNQNKEYNVREVSGYSVGIKGEVSGEVGATGPKGGASLGVTGEFNYSKWLSYDTHEYEIVNRSSNNTFKLAFERGISACDTLVSRDAGACYFSKAWGFGGNVYDLSKYNAIAYANFYPNFDVIYEHEPEYTFYNAGNLEAFRIGFEVQASANFGAVTPELFFSIYEPDGGASTTLVAGTQVTINWDHPLFLPEQNVMIQSLDENDVCLGGRMMSCDEVANTYAWAGLWGLDDKDRYRNHSYYGFRMCLTNQGGYLTEALCNNELSQKWTWEGDRLYSQYEPNGEKYLLTTHGLKRESNLTPQDHVRWAPIIQRPQVPLKAWSNDAPR